jgi:hypothetical protein
MIQKQKQDNPEQKHIFQEWQKRLGVPEVMLASKLGINYTVLSSMANKQPSESDEYQNRSSLIYMERLVEGIRRLAELENGFPCSLQEVGIVLKSGTSESTDLLIDKLRHYPFIPQAWQLIDDLKWASKAVNRLEEFLQAEREIRCKHRVATDVEKIDTWLRSLDCIKEAFTQQDRQFSGNLQQAADALASLDRFMRTERMIERALKTDKVQTLSLRIRDVLYVKEVLSKFRNKCESHNNTDQ